MKPEEALKVVEYLGLHELEDHEAAKSKFEETYLPKTEINNQVGKITSTIASKVAPVLQGFGLDIKADDLKSGRIEDKLVESILKSKELTDNKIKELTELNGNGGAQIVKDWEEKFGKAEKKIQLYETQLKEKDQAIETIKTEFTQKEVQRKKDEFFLGTLSQVDIDPEIKNKVTPKAELTYNGFINTVKSKYKIDLDEKDQFIVTDLEGNPVKDPKKAGAALGLKDVLQHEAAQLGIAKKNPQAGQGNGGFGSVRTIETQQVPSKPSISPKATGGRY